jgi:hypothetical protein
MDKDAILNNFYNNLDVLARIQDGHKLYLDKEQILQLDEPFMFQGIWRYCYGISRKDAIHLLTKLFNDIEIYMNAVYLRNIDIKNSSYPRISKSNPEQSIYITIIEKINKAIIGITNLKLTYKTDELTCTELQRIVDKAKSLVDNFMIMI